MRVYGRIWRTGWALLLTPTALWGLFVGPAAAVLLGAMTAALVTGFVIERRSRFDWAVRGAVAAGGWAAVTCALGGLTALIVAALLAATSPAAARAVLKRRHLTPRTAPPARRDLSLDELRELVQGLDDGELCRAWRSSGELMTHTVNVLAKLGVVALREVYLDEMRRRDPSAFTAWIDGVAASLADPPHLPSPRPPADPDSRDHGPGTHPR